MKVITNQAKIAKFIKWRQNNFTILTKYKKATQEKHYSIIFEAIAYGSKDSNKRLDAIIQHVAGGEHDKVSGDLGYQFIEYGEKGDENSFMS